MRKHWLGPLLAIVLLGALLNLSCGGSDKGTGTTSDGEPPALPEFDFPDKVGIAPINSDAQAAKDLAESYLGAGLENLDLSWFSPNDVTDWGTKTGGCWNGANTGSGCTSNYDVCDTTSGYKWTATLDGNCGGQKPYSNWVATHGVTSTDGRTGNFAFYVDSGIAISRTLTYAVAANDQSGNLQVYTGDDVPANLLATRTFTYNANQSRDYTGENYAFGSLAAGVERVKWELHLSPDPDSGWMKTYTWSGSPAQYRMRNRITWDADSSGSWIEYDANNQILHQHTWQKSTSQPPHLRGLQIPDTVDFCSDDLDAQQAETMVKGIIAAAKGYAALGMAYFAALDSAQWGNVVSGCRSWSYAYGGCSWQYQACEQGNDYHWTYAVDGSCFGQVYNNWTVFQGTTSSDGATGTMIFYELNSTIVQSTWKWSDAADGKSGWWEYYDGIESPTTLQVRLTWTENAGGSYDVVWENFDAGTPQSKWVLHKSADGRSGTMTFWEYNETTSTYWKQQEIIWNSDCSGSSTYYDEEGNIVSQQTWP
ncbi:MAG: hypothetical protein AB1792_05195 [Candidatus Zixiibacteriota bacterium]